MEFSLIRKSLYHLVIIIFLVGVAGCEKEYYASPHPISKHDQGLIKEVGDSSDVIPIQVEDGDFYRTSGFLDPQTFLYIIESSTGNDLFSYDFFKGNKNLLFKSKYPIVSVSISPSRNCIFVHSALSTNQALITILNREGNMILSKEIPSTELTIAWNPYDENRLLLSAFTENWDFTVYELNLSNGSLSEIGLPQPFGYWLDDNQLLYLDWGEGPSLVATLNVYNTGANESKTLFQNIYHVDSSGDMFFSTAVEGEDKEKATYTFYKNTLEKVFAFTIPHLSRFSGWMVPYYDFNEASRAFLIFEPLYSTEVDIYNEDFQLASYHLDTGEKTVLLEEARNEPISCSPNGKYCLMGHYFERLLEVDTRKVYSIVKN